MIFNLKGDSMKKYELLDEVLDLFTAKEIAEYLRNNYKVAYMYDLMNCINNITIELINKEKKKK